MSNLTTLHKKGLNYALFSEKRMVFRRQEDPFDKQRRLAEALAEIEEVKSRDEEERESKKIAEDEIPTDETREKVVKTGVLGKDVIEGEAAEKVLRERAVDKLVRLRQADRKKYEAIVSRFFGKPETRKVRWYQRLWNRWEESRNIVDAYVRHINYEQAYRSLSAPKTAADGSPYVDEDGNQIDFKGENKFAVLDEDNKEKGYLIINWLGNSLFDVEGKLVYLKQWDWFKNTKEGKNFIEFRKRYDKSREELEKESIALKDFLQDAVLQELFSRERSIISITGFDEKALLKALAEDETKDAKADIQVVSTIRQEVSDEIKAGIRTSVYNEVQNAVQSDMQKEIEAEIEKQMLNEIKPVVQNEIASEVQSEIWRNRDFLQFLHVNGMPHAEAGKLDQLRNDERQLLEAELNHRIKDEMDKRKDEFGQRIQAELEKKNAEFHQRVKNEMDKRKVELTQRIKIALDERVESDFNAGHNAFEQRIQAEFEQRFAEVKEREEHKVRLWKKSINYLLKIILGDDIHSKTSKDDPDNHAARAALRFIISKTEDPRERKAMVDFLRRLANEPSETIVAMKELREAAKKFIKTIEEQFIEREKIDNQIEKQKAIIKLLEAEANDLEGRFVHISQTIGSAHQEDKIKLNAESQKITEEKNNIRQKLEEALKELTELPSNKTPYNKTIIEAIQEFGDLLWKHKEYTKDPWIDALSGSLNNQFIASIIELSQNPPPQTSVKKTNLAVDSIERLFEVGKKSVNELSLKLKKRIKKEELEELQAVATTGELSARDLLVLLHDHDLEQAGERNETERFKRALTLANLHAAQCKTADQAIPANKAIARGIHGNDWRRALREEIDETRAMSMFSPYTSAETALMLLTRNEKFKFLRGINTSSTPYRIQRMIDRHNEQYPDEPVTANVLREFVVHMQKFITGIVVPGMDKRKRVIDAHVRRFEGLKTIMANLAEVAFVQEVIDEIPESVEGDKQKVLIDLLKRKNLERASADLEIKESLKATMDPESDVFHRYMDKQNLIDDYRSEIAEVDNSVGSFWDGIKEAASQVTGDEIPMEKLRNFHRRKYAALNEARLNSKIPKEYRSQLQGRAFLREAKDFTTYVLRYPFVLGFQLAYGIHKTPGIIGTVGKWSWTKIRNGYARFVNWYNKPPS